MATETALITGASSGIGLELARLFAADRSNLVLVARSEGKLEALAEELAGSPVRVTCLAPGPTATGFGADSGMEKSLMFRLGTMDARTVARAGYHGFRRGKVIVVPGLLNRVGAFSVRLGPRAFVRKLVKRLQGSVPPPRLPAR